MNLIELFFEVRKDTKHGLREWMLCESFSEIQDMDKTCLRLN